MRFNGRFPAAAGFIAVSVLLLCTVAVTAIASEEKLIVIAADPWCPYNCNPGDELPGYLVEVAEAVFQPHGYTVKYIQLPWTRALHYAKTGKIHAAIGAVRGDAAGNHIGGESLGKDETVFVVRKGETFHFTDVLKLDDKKIGVIRNYTYDNHGEIDQYIKKRAKQKDSNLSVLSQETALDAMFRMLLSRRIDLFPENRFVAVYKARQIGISDRIEIVPTGKSDEIFLAFTPNEEGKKLSELFDKGVARLKETGELTHILQKYGIDDWK